MNQRKYFGESKSEQQRREDENVMKLRRIPVIATVSNPTTSMQEEQELYHREKQKERINIIYQPHRTFPAIQPKPKPRHDYPQGSYLKYVKDPTWNNPSAVHKTPTIKVEEILSNMSRGGGGVMNNSYNPQANVVHSQYNSPLNVYSKDNIRNVLHSGDPSSSSSSSSPSLPPLLQPTTTTRLSPIKDFRDSPTYRMILEEEERHHQQQQQQHHHQQQQQHHRSSPIQSSTFQTLMNHYR